MAVVLPAVIASRTSVQVMSSIRTDRLSAPTPVAPLAKTMVTRAISRFIWRNCKISWANGQRRTGGRAPRRLARRRVPVQDALGSAESLQERQARRQRPAGEAAPDAPRRRRDRD